MATAKPVVSLTVAALISACAAASDGNTSAPAVHASAPAQGKNAPPDPSVAAQFLGARTSDWNGSISSSTLTITQVFPDGSVYGSYEWGKAFYTSGGRVDFRAFLNGRTFEFGTPNVNEFPYYKFTLNDDGTMSAIRQSQNYDNEGKFSAPKPLSLPKPSFPDPKAFQAAWNCSWVDINHVRGQNTLWVRAPVDGAFHATYIWTQAPSQWGITKSVEMRQVSIVADRLRFGVLEFELMPDGTLKGSRYAFGYRQWVDGRCVKR